MVTAVEGTSFGKGGGCSCGLGSKKEFPVIFLTGNQNVDRDVTQILLDWVIISYEMY